HRRRGRRRRGTRDGVVRELAGLKTRLFWNGLRTDRQRQIGLPLILGLVGWIAWRATSGHLSMLDTLGPEPMPHYLAWVGVILFVAWVALPVVIFPIDE